MCCKCLTMFAQTKTVVGAIQVGQNPRHVCLTEGVVFGSTCQYRLSSAVDEGWRFVPDAILPGHRRAPQDTHGTLGPGQREGRGWPVWIRQQIYGNTHALAFARCVVSKELIHFRSKENLHWGANGWSDRWGASEGACWRLTCDLQFDQRFWNPSSRSSSHGRHAVLCNVCGAAQFCVQGCVICGAFVVFLQ